MVKGLLFFKRLAFFVLLLGVLCINLKALLPFFLGFTNILWLAAKKKNDMGNMWYYYIFFYINFLYMCFLHYKNSLVSLFEPTFHGKASLLSHNESSFSLNNSHSIPWVPSTCRQSVLTKWSNSVIKSIHVIKIYKHLFKVSCMCKWLFLIRYRNHFTKHNLIMLVIHNYLLQSPN